MKIPKFLRQLLDPNLGKTVESPPAEIVPATTPPFGVFAHLTARLAPSCQSDLNRAFVWWLLRNPEGRAAFASIATMAAKREGAAPDFLVAATLGFAADSGVLSASEMAAFKDGLTVLAGRAPVANGIPLAFHADPAGVLGVALGTAAVGDPHTTELVAGWAAGFLQTSYAPDRAEDWERCLLAVADRKIGQHLGLVLPTSDDTADVRIALLSVGLLDTYTPQDVALTLALTRGAGTRDFGCERLALHLKALQWIQRLASSAAAKLRPSSPSSAGNPDVQVSREPFRRGGIPSARNDGGKLGIATTSGAGNNLATQPDDELITHDKHGPRRGLRRKKQVRRNAKYEAIDTALSEIAETLPTNHEEVFRWLADRKVPLPNREPFRSARGWLKGAEQDPHAASAWLSQAWARLGLPPFRRGPKK